MQGIEEDEISFARELFPKTRQHGLAIGIRLKDDLEEDEGDQEEEEGEVSVYKRQEGAQKYKEEEEEEEEREYEEEETSARESELSSASDSVSLEVFNHLKLLILKSIPTGNSAGTQHRQEWKAVLPTFVLTSFQFPP